MLRATGRASGPAVPLAAAVVALALYAVVSRGGAHLTGMLLAVGLAVLVLPSLSRRPTLCVSVLLVLLPLQTPLYGFLFVHGAPGALVRQLGAVKDLVLVALVLGALRDGRRRPLALADRWALGFVAVATAYLVLPFVVPTAIVVPFGQRVLAWRIDVFFVLVLLALRRTDPSRLDVGRLRTVLLAVAAVVAAGAVYEFLDPTAWADLLYRTLGVQQYSAQVLDTPLRSDAYIRYAADGSVRAGSFLRDPVSAGFFLLPGLFLALTRISSRRSVPAALVTGLVSAGLVFTNTRSALLVGLLGVVFATTRVLRSGRYNQVFVVVLAVLLLFGPGLVAQSSVVDRVAATFTGEDTSTQDHTTDITRGLSRAVTHPLGAGLGTGAGVGQRFDVSGQVVTENAYLQVINEMGVFALVPFLGMLLTLTGALLRLPRGAGGVVLDRTAAAAVAVAFVLGGFLQTVWLDFGVAVTAAVALALPFLSTADQEADEAAPVPAAAAG